MTEADVVTRLADYTDTLLAGVSVFFTVVSAYVAALNYFIRKGSIAGRLSAFVFLSFILVLLGFVMLGAQTTHMGLIARLHELERAGQVTAAGQAVLDNALAVAPGLGSSAAAGVEISIDQAVMMGMWGGMALTYLALFFLTFVFSWGERREAGIVE